MKSFIAGLIVALAAVLPAALLFLRSSAAGGKDVKKKHSRQVEELSRLTGKLAHEIKNPLSTIKVNLRLIGEELETLDSDKCDHKFARLLKKIGIIQKESDRLEHILDGFLRYVDRAELRLAEADINEIVSDMVDFYSPQAQSNSIAIRLGIFGRPLVCKVDADMLKQAVLNLFINAQQAMQGGGELIVKTDMQKTDAVIQIGDTGSGIAPDKLAGIFDAYYSSKHPGSGLGLPTTKKIIEAHKGRIAVNSEQGKGTLFTITLPMKY